MSELLELAEMNSAHPRVSEPVRLQLSRRRGFDLQALSEATNGLPAVKVTRPGAWGNPFRVGEDLSYYSGETASIATDEQCVDVFRRFVAADRSYDMSALRGKNLACWCKAGAPCHADVLLDLANRPVCEAVEGSGSQLADANSSNQEPIL